jgi:hypothetical protein
MREWEEGRWKEMMIEWTNKRDGKGIWEKGGRRQKFIFYLWII